MNRIKKHRGLRRYYKNLELKNEDWSELKFTDSDNAWFDRWHTHFDWYGYGNDSFKRRKPHLDKLFRHFDLLSDRAKSLTVDFQIWITILDNDSASDALFLHTPNPNQNNFPWKISGLSETSTLTNQRLIDYINNLVGYEKLFGNADEAYCVLYKKNIGIIVA
ncbi:hypothetical protein EV200_109119 [Pedobacter psychrotolerans]|uniref:Uncharacterized protein n=1 Tax=Pedobacter psychrotolerans TaxID=1843235 RepID=A0A4R2H419_9SPHI|nr:hypothetical protein [Pedobacter psychrotolerans]TCO19936.1 hypothetical protein EV200_109119 [Pedobacter psychrotolerans]GGE49960.1 hypothetical protein GCM10011413_15210 [Pedobacter psychrotolerans]